MSLESKIVASLREELDSRGFGSTEFNVERFETSMQQQTNNIVTELLKRTNLTERAILEAREHNGKSQRRERHANRMMFFLVIIARKMTAVSAVLLLCFRLRRREGGLWSVQFAKVDRSRD